MIPASSHPLALTWSCSLSAVGFLVFLWGESLPAQAPDRWAILLGAGAALITAGTPAWLGYLRFLATEARRRREDEWRVSENERHVREDERHVRDVEGQLAVATARLDWLDAVDRQKDEKIKELQIELADTRAHQNETRARVVPPLAPLPPGPSDRRLIESGEYPAVPNGGTD